MNQLLMVTVALIAVSFSSGAAQAACSADFLAGEYVLEGQSARPFPGEDRFASDRRGAPALPAGVVLSTRVAPKIPVTLQVLDCSTLALSQDNQQSLVWIQPTDTFHEGWGGDGRYAETVAWTSKSVKFSLRNRYFLSFRSADITIEQDQNGNLVVHETIVADGLPLSIFPAVLADETYTLIRLR